EAEQVEQVVDAGLDVGVQEGQRGEADAPGRARAGCARDAHGAGRVVVLDGPGQSVRTGGDGGEPAQRGVEQLDLLGGGALLRPVDGGGAVRAEQRVVDVARHHERHAGHVEEVRDVDAVEVTQRGAAVRQVAPGGVEQARAERLDHARSPVGAGAAAQAEHDPGGALLDGVGDQLAGAVAGGGERFEPAGQAAQAGRLGQLDDGGAAAPGVGGLDGLAGGPGHPYGDAVEPGGHGGVHGAVTAVGDGQLDGGNPEIGR